MNLILGFFLAIFLLFGVCLILTIWGCAIIFCLQGIKFLFDYIFGKIHWNITKYNRLRRMRQLA